MRVFPAYLQGGCAYLYSPDPRRGSGTARAARRYVAIGQGLAPAASMP